MRDLRGELVTLPLLRFLVPALIYDFTAVSLPSSLRVVPRASGNFWLTETRRGFPPRGFQENPTKPKNNTEKSRKNKKSIADMYRV